MSGNILGIVHVCTLDRIEGKVRDEVDGGNVVAIDQLSGFLVAGEAVELFGPVGLDFGGTEPLAEGLDSLGLLFGTAGLVKDAEILGNVVGAVLDVDEVPVLGLKSADQRIGGAVCRGVDLAVQSGGVELGNCDVALVQRVKAVLVVIAAGDTVRAELPQSLPAVLALVVPPILFWRYHLKPLLMTSAQ